MTVKAIYENGVFRPVSPVSLPEKLEVDVLLPEAKSSQREIATKKIIAILSRSYQTGQTDTAERHNEHQP